MKAKDPIREHYKKIGKQGGEARAKKLSAPRRSEIASQAAHARWPEKRRTSKCKVEHCKVTVPHEHLPPQQ